MAGAIRRCCVLVLLVFVAAALPALAAPRHGRPDAQLTEDARLQQWRWMRQAAAAARTEVVAGKLASVRGSTPGVRRFGKKMMNRGETVGHRLALLSLRTQVPLPYRPASEDRHAIAQLRSLRGEAFDRVFLQHFGTDLQERQLSLYRSMLAAGEIDPGLRRLAGQAVPPLERELAAARALRGDAEPQAANAPAEEQPAQRPLPDAHSPGMDASDREAMESVYGAAALLRSIKQDRAFDALLQKARGVLLFPHYRRGAVVLGLRFAQGIIVTRHGSGVSAPAFYRMEGGSIGLQAGAASGPTAYLLMTDAAVEQFRSVKTVSFDLSAGVTWGLDSQWWQASTGKVRDVVVWSGARGAYGGAAVGMTQIVPDADANRAYYGREVSASEILGGGVPNPYDNILERLLGS